MTRNPTIASLLNRIQYIEKMGTGINRMKEACKEAGISEPEFIITGFFTILFRRKTSENIGLNIGLNETQIEVVELMKKDSKINILQISEIINMSKRNIEVNVSDLKKRESLKGLAQGKMGFGKLEELRR